MNITNIETFFEIGMKRSVGIKEQSPGLVVNLGAGKSKMPGAHNLDLPSWDARFDPIPFEPETVDEIHAHHFLEHLQSSHVKTMLAEAQRVLKPGGCMFITVPLWKSKLAHEDINHMTFFSIDTWKELFSSRFYDTGGNDEPWRFDVVFNMILGIDEDNLAICTQLVKQG